MWNMEILCCLSHMLAAVAFVLDSYRQVAESVDVEGIFYQFLVAESKGFRGRLCHLNFLLDSHFSLVCLKCAEKLVLYITYTCV